ncbi:MAG: hypothetical protein AB7O68_26320 [Pirellulales bacterium]
MVTKAMLRSPLFCGVAIGLLFSASGLFGVGNAAVVVQSFPFSYNSVSSQNVLGHQGFETLLNQFDPALGVLNGVNFSAEITETVHDFSVDNRTWFNYGKAPGPGSEITVAAELQGGAALVLAGADGGAWPLFVTTPSVTLLPYESFSFGDVSATVTLSAPYNNFYDVLYNPIDLADFIGLGKIDAGLWGEGSSLQPVPFPEILAASSG